MTRIPIRALALAGTLLLMVPGAAASHWTDTYDGEYNRFAGTTCWWMDANCTTMALCTGEAPPQVVDLALHCAGRLAAGADDAVLWVPEVAWFQVDEAAEIAENQPSAVNAATSAQRDELNDVLCGQVWSFFCTNPVALPEHIPIADPIGPEPLP